MSSNNNSPLSPVISVQLSLERLREYIAGALAIIIVLGMVWICAVAIQNLGSDEAFQRSKDLLLIITPFVGVVIGYYFNKVTSDSRAAALQRAAEDASATATQATLESERAQTLAATAQTQATEYRDALSEMVNSAAPVVTTPEKAPGVLGAEENAPMTDAQIEFRVAYERAKRALNN